MSGDDNSLPAAQSHPSKRSYACQTDGSVVTKDAKVKAC